MNDLSLYHIANEYSKVLQIIDSIEDPKDLNEAVFGVLENVEKNFEKKIENYGYIIKKFKAEIIYLDDEIKRLKERILIRDYKIDWLKENIKNIFMGLSIKRIETPSITVRLQENPPHVEIMDESKIPKEFKELVITTSVKKRDILNHFKLTGELPLGVDIKTDASVRVQ